MELFNVELCAVRNVEFLMLSCAQAHFELFNVEFLFIVIIEFLK